LTKKATKEDQKLLGGLIEAFSGDPLSRLLLLKLGVRVVMLVGDWKK